MTRSLTSDNDEGVGRGEDAASVVQRFTSVGSGILRPDVANGEAATTLTARHGHALAARDVAPVETPDNERGGDAHSLAVDGESAVDLYLQFWSGWLDDGGYR
jgi:hypothetical protein